MNKQNKFRAILLLLPFSFLFSACLEKYGDTIILPELYEATPEAMLPSYLLESLSEHVTINSGKRPPNIEGEYLFSKVLLSYATDPNNVPSGFGDCYIKFSNQNSRNLCVYYEEQGGSQTFCDSAMIVGHDDVFTFVGKLTSTNSTDNTRCVFGTLISGRITSEGITDFSYAIYMIEKDDPNNRLMDVGAYRVFYDGDGLVKKYNWYNSKREHPVLSEDPYSMMARKEAAQ